MENEYRVSAADNQPIVFGGQAVAVSIFEAIHVHNDPRALSELEAVHRKEVGRYKLVGS